MKPELCLAVWAMAFQSALAGDITFTNRTATFKDLQGRTYRHVQLIRGDSDGLIWRDGASGGRICYTNLDANLLESFGISSNRIEVAKARAEKKAIADARYRSTAFARPQPKPGQAEPTNAVEQVSSSSWSTAPDSVNAPYPITYPYPQVVYYGFGGPGFAASAPSAASSPTAQSALNSPIPPGAEPSLNSRPALGVPLAPLAPAAPTAPSAPSPAPVRRR